MRGGIAVVGAAMPAVVIAAAFGGPEALSVIDEPTGEPGPGEARIEVRAAGVNPVDYKVYSGAFGTDPAQLPIRLGSEAAGVVTAVGPGAAGPAGQIAAGDEVIAYRAPGAHAAEPGGPAQGPVPEPAPPGPRRGGPGWADRRRRGGDRVSRARLLRGRACRAGAGAGPEAGRVGAWRAI